MGLKIKSEGQDRQTTVADLRPGDVFVFSQHGWCTKPRLYTVERKAVRLDGMLTTGGESDAEVRILPPGTLLEVE